ncbi:hypothetical protein HYQ44_019358 [Verticillium longisporum]|nr:hypothetical protein HYQ44_019358 [Verticillium longisporum]
MAGKTRIPSKSEVQSPTVELEDHPPVPSDLQAEGGESLRTIEGRDTKDNTNRRTISACHPALYCVPVMQLVLDAQSPNHMH